MKWYLYRDFRTIKIAHVDQDGALALYERGYELGNKPFDTHEEARDEQRKWTDRLSDPGSK